MKTKFVLILLLLALVFSGWTFIGYLLSRELSQTYENLSALPIYAYVGDSAKLKPILEGLNRFGGQLTYKHETGFQAAMELIEAYQLPHTDVSIADYKFPDVVTITFPAEAMSIQTKAKVMDLLRLHLSEDDIDSQSFAYGKLIEELRHRQENLIIFSVFIALLILLVVVFGRLSYEGHLFFANRHLVPNRLEAMRMRKLKSSRSLATFLFPALFVLAIYYLGAYFKLWLFALPWWHFALMGGVSGLGTLFAHISLKMYEEVEKEASFSVEKPKEKLMESKDA